MVPWVKQEKKKSPVKVGFGDCSFRRNSKKSDCLDFTCFEAVCGRRGSNLLIYLWRKPLKT